MHIASCSSCHRPIIWSLSPAGARLPLDARPVAVYALDEQTETPTAIRIELGPKLYISHFLTCPNAAQHSRPVSVENGPA